MAAVAAVESLNPNPSPPRQCSLTCEGGPHGEVVLVDAQQVAGLHLPGLGSIQQLLRQRTGNERRILYFNICSVLISQVNLLV